MAQTKHKVWCPGCSSYREVWVNRITQRAKTLLGFLIVPCNEHKGVPQ